MKRLCLALTFFVITFSSFSQSTGIKIPKNDLWQKTRILFVVDCSKSMGFKWQSDTKIKITQTILSNIIDSLNGRDNVELALRTFGSGENETKETCNDSFLDVPFFKNNLDVMKAKLKALVPKGITPLTYSLKRVEEDFPDCENCRNIIILITDGMDDCNENPCEISEALQHNGKIHPPFVIGIGALRSHLGCIGNYFETTNEIEFSQTLNAIIAQLLDKTSCQVNLLDYYMEANETNVPLTFYDHQSQLPKLTCFHTFNAKGLSDTLVLDPLLTYDLVVHTLPEVRMENIKLLPARHTVIPVQIPQGSLIVKFAGKASTNNQNIPVIIRKTSTTKVLNTQSLNEMAKYLTGVYDIEILSLPRLSLEGIEISQSAITTIEIPASGIVQISKAEQMLGSLFVKENGMLQWVYNLNESLLNENIALLPGEYLLVLRAKKNATTAKTLIKEFKIESAQTTAVTLLDNGSSHQSNKNSVSKKR